MAIKDKLNATDDEILSAADAEIAELSSHERPMVIGVINEA